MKTDEEAEREAARKDPRQRTIDDAAKALAAGGVRAAAQALADAVNAAQRVGLSCDARIEFARQNGGPPSAYAFVQIEERRAW